TFTAFLMGLCYGFFLYPRQTLPRIAMAVAVHQFVLSLLLNTLWISILYGSPFAPLLVTRLVSCAVLTAVQLAVIPLIVKILPQLKRSLS
ncbi:MAG: folate family ECF transporter S component, partial [Oscillospiraceae bacterium]|nr:folate family ECF transporter S component [Oscillospiraceae bacterium]